LQGHLEDGRHFAIEERLAAGEVVFLNTERDRLVEIAAHGVQRQKAEVVIVRPTADEAVRALEVTQRAGNLKPQVIKVRQRHNGELHANPPVKA
jgi:hypothetical protein